MQDNAVIAAKEGRLGDAIAFIGMGLHTTQDLLSHSNYAEMKNKDQKKFRDFIYKRIGSLPKNILATEWDPAAKIPGIPEGSPYAHNLRAKDTLWQNEFSSSRDENDIFLYQKAYDAAVQHSLLYLDGIVKNIDAKDWTSIRHTHIWDVFPPIPAKGRDDAPCRNKSVWWVTHGGSGTVCGEE